MRAWSLFMVRNRFLEIALAVALGIGAYEVLNKISEAAVNVLAQHVGTSPTGDAFSDLVYGPYNLYVDIAGTYVVYGQALVGAISLALVGIAGLLVIRRRDKTLAECPFCASRIPFESTHCAYCGSGVSPGTP